MRSIWDPLGAWILRISHLFHVIFDRLDRLAATATQ
jgi:hypothetical protein